MKKQIIDAIEKQRVRFQKASDTLLAQMFRELEPIYHDAGLVTPPFNVDGRTKIGKRILTKEIPIRQKYYNKVRLLDDAFKKRRHQIIFESWTPSI